MTDRQRLVNFLRVCLKSGSEPPDARELMDKGFSAMDILQAYSELTDEAERERKEAEDRLQKILEKHKKRNVQSYDCFVLF